MKAFWNPAKKCNRDYKEWVPLESYVCLHGQMFRSDQLNLDGVIQKRNVSNMQKKIIAANQGWKCYQCGHLLSACWEVDHVLSLMLGGSNDRDNLVALCRECHGKKTIFERLYSHLNKS
jgi:hypothetical protein